MLRLLFASVLFALMTACAMPEQTASQQSSAILPEWIANELRPGQGDFAPDLVYVSEAARKTSYDKVLIDPIMYFAPLEQVRTVSPEDRQTLINNFHILMARELGKDFLLAVEPQRGTVRVQFAVLPVTQEPVALDSVAMVARVDPQKEVVSDVLTTPIGPGFDLLVEAEWTDAVTGEVLGATVDRHFGQAEFDGTGFKSWADVNRYLEAYAKLIRYRLCRFRELNECSPPPAPRG